MTKATISQARTQLAALRGERVLITRGAKSTVAIVTVADDETASLSVSDAAADYLTHEARAELEAGVAQVHESPAAFAASLTKPHRRP